MNYNSSSSSYPSMEMGHSLSESDMLMRLVHSLSGSEIEMFPDWNRYDTISSNIKEEDEKMSLVGIVKTVHGVAVFGDSKSSVRERGVLKPNPSKPYVKKVFRHNNFIFSTSGVNQIFLKDEGWSHLDDAIERRILTDSSVDPDNFMECMRGLFQYTKLSGDTCFHVGYKRYGKYEAFTSTLHPDGNVETYGMANDFDAKWSGTGELVPSFFCIRRDMTMDEVRGFIDEYMEHVIALTDLLLDYSPIGGDVLIETLS